MKKVLIVCGNGLGSSFIVEMNVKKILAEMNKEAEEKLAQIEDAIQDQIDELLSFNLDNTLIEQLRIANQKLNALLK